MAGEEPVWEWLEGLDPAERQAIGTELLRPQWRWPVGDPDRLANQAHGGRVAMPVLCAPRDAARIHREDADWAGIGSGSREETAEGTGAMSRESLGTRIDEFLSEEGILEGA